MSSPKVDKHKLLQQHSSNLLAVLHSEQEEKIWDLMDEYYLLIADGVPPESEQLVRIGNAMHEIFVSTANAA